MFFVKFVILNIKYRFVNVDGRLNTKVVITVVFTAILYERRSKRFEKLILSFLIISLLTKIIKKHC